MDINKRIIALVGISLFAITLAIVIGSRLTGEAMMIALGIAVGLVVGIPVGVLAITIGQRAQPHSRGAEEASTSLGLTSEQFEQLLRALDRPQQASPDTFTLPPRQNREFSAVGGAELDDTFDDPQ